MVHYRHRRYWGVAPLMLAAGLLAAPVIALRGEPLAAWIDAWPVHLFVLAVWGWYWFMVGRHISRRVEVADDGLWIDGEWQVGAADIVAVALAQDPVSSFHLKRFDDGGRSSGGLSYWLGRNAWLQRNWARVFDVEDVGSVAVLRSHDLARGSGWHAVLVVSKRSVGRGDAADHKRGWLLGTYRDRRLVEALERVSPEARFVDARDARGRA